MKQLLTAMVTACFMLLLTGCSPTNEPASKETVSETTIKIPTRFANTQPMTTHPTIPAETFSAWRQAWNSRSGQIEVLKENGANNTCLILENDAWMGIAITLDGGVNRTLITFGVVEENAVMVDCETAPMLLTVDNETQLVEGQDESVVKVFSGAN